MARVLMRQTALLFAAILAGLPGVVTADPLAWPLPDSKTLTGGFADSRQDHFHGGVDLRTYGRDLPVVAPTDGWIERLAVNPAGYGRTLYLRLNDGRTAVFAHLSRFAPPIEKLMRDAQLEAGTYRVNVVFERPDTLRTFRRGDTLAFTGSTGIGPPHLHFELREGAIQTDPLKDYMLSDGRSPVVIGLWWTNLSCYSPTECGTSLKLTSASHGVQRASPVRSEEPVAFFIQCYDPGPWGRNAVPAVIRVRVGSQVVFEDRPTRIDLQGRRNIYEKIVWAERKRRNRDIRRLFLPPAAFPRRIPNSTESGWLNELDRTEVRIEVVDRAGNTTTVVVPVSCGQIPDQSHEGTPDAFTCGRFSITADSLSSTQWARLLQTSESELTIAPTDLAFGDRIRLTYHRPEGEDSTGTYWYERTTRGTRKPLWTVANSADSVTCLVLRGGTYGVAADSVPPNLTLFVKGGVLHFSVTDALSGVDDSSIRCTVDGNPSVAEFEYEERGGTIWCSNVPDQGPHSVVLTAGDRAGNVDTLRAEIRIP